MHVIKRLYKKETSIQKKIDQQEIDNIIKSLTVTNERIPFGQCPEDVSQLYFPFLALVLLGSQDIFHDIFVEELAAMWF